jgi:hypothetical protein
LQSIAQLILKSLKKNDRDEMRGSRDKRKEFSYSNYSLISQYCSNVSSPLSLPPSQLAAACAIPVKYERLPLAFGRVVYLAEAILQPPGITVNLTAIEKLTTCTAEVSKEYRAWFTEVALREVIIAHELYHIFAQQPSGKCVEAQAHEFAQALTGLPFDPQVYEEILRQTIQWTTNNITLELMEDRVTRQH